MQPIDHISAGKEYLFEPRRISGALYQRVAMYSVLSCFGKPGFIFAIVRARPKSARRMSHSLVIRMFEGFRSL